MNESICPNCGSAHDWERVDGRRGYALYRCTCCFETTTLPPEGFRFECEGYGSVPAKYMFVGISAGRLGALITKVPFTKDASGRLFQRCLATLGLSDSEETSLAPALKDCYVTNMVKGRCLKPDGRNRLPTRKEIDYWFPVLLTEIEKVQPARIVTLGKLVCDRISEWPDRPCELTNVYHPRWYAAHGAMKKDSPSYEKMVIDYKNAVFG